MYTPTTKMLYSLTGTALLAFSSMAHAEANNFSSTSVSFNDNKLTDSIGYTNAGNINGGPAGGFHRDDRKRLKDEDHKVKIKHPQHHYTKITSPVPEPETYAMLLVGLALVGVTARRRNK